MAVCFSCQHNRSYEFGYCRNLNNRMYVWVIWWTLYMIWNSIDINLLATCLRALVACLKEARSVAASGAISYDSSSRSIKWGSNFDGKDLAKKKTLMGRNAVLDVGIEDEIHVARHRVSSPMQKTNSHGRDFELLTCGQSDRVQMPYHHSFKLLCLPHPLII